MAVVAATVIARWFGGSVGGIFAAFPAVMVAAVIMTGVFEGSRQAADVALGGTGWY